MTLAQCLSMHARVGVCGAERGGLVLRPAAEPDEVLGWGVRRQTCTITGLWQLHICM